MTITSEDFRISEEDQACIAKLVARVVLAANASQEPGTVRVDPASLTMDLTIYHKRHGLKLQALLTAAPHDFFHDVVGIMRHMDRSTGELDGPFLPLYSSFGEVSIKAA